MGYLSEVKFSFYRNKILLLLHCIFHAIILIVYVKLLLAVDFNVVGQYTGFELIQGYPFFFRRKKKKKRQITFHV
ncbi:hypothetical protein BCR42DRAFT_415748, partial [Absidia repens]